MADAGINGDDDDTSALLAGAEARASCWRSCCAEPATPTKHSELRVRWLVLALLCCGLLGSYYCYDIPAATMTQMEEAFGGGNSTSADDDGGGGCSASASSFPTNFNLLYSVRSCGTPQRHPRRLPHPSPLPPFPLPPSYLRCTAGPTSSCPFSAATSRTSWACAS